MTEGVYFDPPRTAIIRDLLGHLAGGDGPMLLVGESGAGKTTLLHRVAEDAAAQGIAIAPAIAGEGRFAALGAIMKGANGAGPMAGGRAFARVLVDDAEECPLVLWHRLAAALRNPLLAPALPPFVIAIPPEMLPEVSEFLLSSADMPDARIRRLAPLAASDVANFLLWRLGDAGHATPQLFSDEAARRIAAATGGLPGPICRLCDEVVAFSRDGDWRSIAAISATLAGEPPPAPPPPDMSSFAPGPSAAPSPAVVGGRPARGEIAAIGPAIARTACPGPAGPGSVRTERASPGPASPGPARPAPARPESARGEETSERAAAGPVAQEPSWPVGPAVPGFAGAGWTGADPRPGRIFYAADLERGRPYRRSRLARWAKRAAVLAVLAVVVPGAYVMFVNAWEKEHRVPGLDELPSAAAPAGSPASAPWPGGRTGDAPRGPGPDIGNFTTAAPAYPGGLEDGPAVNHVPVTATSALPVPTPRPASAPKPVQTAASAPAPASVDRSVSPTATPNAARTSAPGASPAISPATSPAAAPPTAAPSAGRAPRSAAQPPIRTAARTEPEAGAGTGAAAGGAASEEDPDADEPASRPKSVEEIIAIGDDFVRSGDFGLARRYYQAARERGSARATRALAGTYDPRFVPSADGARPKAAFALYEEALEQGERAAAKDIENLEQWLDAVR